MNPDEGASDPSTRTQMFTDMWHQHASAVLAYALRHVDRHDAEEVVAETFLVAWRRWANVPAQPLPWLLVVARNTISNHRRSAYRRAALHEQVERLNHLAGPVPGAEVATLHRADALAALAALTPAEREALLLTVWDGLSPSEAARVAGCSTATFHVRLFRARRRLKAYRGYTAEPTWPLAHSVPLRTSE